MTFQTGRRGRRGDEPSPTGTAGGGQGPGSHSEDAESVARAITLRLLTGAARSRAQLADALARKDIPEAVAEKVLDRFTEVGLIDDEEFARMLVRTRHTERGLSRRAIAVELRRKGIDDELAGAALQEVDADDEEAAARALVRRKLAATSSLDGPTRARRTFAALGRKGYPPGLVARLVREELAAVAVAAPDDLGDLDPGS